MRVDDEDHVGQAVGLTQAAEHALQLFELVLQTDGFLLRQRLELAGFFAPLEVFHAPQARQNGGEVGQRAAHPALVDEWHASLGGLFGDGVLGLLLGADEQHGFAFGGLLTDKRHSLVEATHRLLQIDDVDAVALGEDERPHTRIPPTRLMAKMHPRFEQGLHLDRCRHGTFL